MPAKTSTTSQKKSSTTKSTRRSTRKSPAPAKSSKGRSSSSSKAKPSQSTRKTSTRSRSTPSPASRLKWDGLSPDRKLDIVGIILALTGVLTLLSLLSPVNGSLTGTWVSLISKGLGWGMYLLPILLLGGGMWLVLRNFDRIPRLEVERVIGFTLLFISLLASAHFILSAYREADLYILATQGSGGGYLGAVVVKGLQTALGKGGTVIALVAVFMIALALTLDITVYEMVNWVGKVLSPVKTGLVNGWTAIKSRIIPTAANSAYPELTPLVRSSIPISQDEAGAASFPTYVTDSAHAWVLPPIEQILDAGEETVYSDESDRVRAHIIEETLKSFGAPVQVVEINRGPTITQFGVEPDFIETRNGRTRVRVGKIVSLADDLALALAARTIRIQAPVPGKGYVGIEAPNEVITQVMLRDVLETETFKRMKSPLRFALGQNVAGLAMVYDLSAMPHLLIAGATGSGKSVCVNALICCLLMNNTPESLRLIMVDPKRVELTGYNGIPHLLAPVVVDLEKVVSALQWVTREMDMRYRKLNEAGVRNLSEYNNKVQADKKMPHLVVLIDELADLMMLAPDETERTITRLAQMSRATGIHLVIATQRPSVEVVTGLIKANFPARIAFAVASNVDSRVILDQPGAERLLGRGDMLFQAPDAPAPVRLQGVFVSDTEIFRLVTYWQSVAGTAEIAQTSAPGAPDALPGNIPLKQLPMWNIGESIEDDDPLMKEAVDLSRRQGRASISMLQRRLRIGYTRAARLVETMEERGIVGPPEPGTGTREILDYGDAAPPVDD